MRGVIGRPSVGPTVLIRAERELIDRLDSTALLLGVSRAELVRRFLRDGLERLDNPTEVTNAR